jgi:cytoskeletal protein RodZ
MSVVTRPFTGFYRNYSNDRPSHAKLVRLSETDRVLDEPIKVAAYSGLPDDGDTFTLGTEPPTASIEAPSFEGSLEAESPHEETWAALEVEKTLGQVMTESRKYRGFSREQVAEQTSIPEYYIRMIESDCYDAIPDQLYLLPFFQRYAIFLGIDAQQVVARFIRDFEKAENEVVAPPASRKAPVTNGMHRWRRIAEAAAIVGILLPLAGWEIGAMRAAHSRKINDSNVVVSSAAQPSPAIASAAQPSPAIATADARPDTPAQVPAPLPVEVTTAAKSGTIPQAPPAPHVQTRQHRHSRTHQLSHHWRHPKRVAS